MKEECRHLESNFKMSKNIYMKNLDMHQIKISVLTLNVKSRIQMYKGGGVPPLIRTSVYSNENMSDDCVMPSFLIPNF